MFSYLKGLLMAAYPASVIVDVQGIGYSVFIPHRLFGRLPPIGEAIQLYTTFVVRELCHALYGFLSAQERDTFEILMNVSGIGPKLALSLIGHLDLTELQTAVAEKDIPTLCRVPGVGKKTAERLIVELKDKLSTFSSMDSSSVGVFTSHQVQLRHVQDAILALIHLGYNQQTAQKAIKQSLIELPDTHDLALLITTALRKV